MIIIIKCYCDYACMYTTGYKYFEVACGIGFYKTQNTNSGCELHTCYLFIKLNWM